MNTFISVLLLVGGIAMIMCGADAAQSLASDIPRTVAVPLVDKSAWLIIGGIVPALMGLSGVVRRITTS